MSDREGNRSMTTHCGASQVERTWRVDIQEVSNPDLPLPERRAYRRRNDGTQQFDRAQHIRVRHGAD